MSNTRSLSEQIERLVREHVADIHREATAAVERAFASKKTRTSAKSRPRQPSSSTSARRESGQLAALAERLYSEVCATPGETMAVLAERIGATPRELNRPMNNLRQAGRLRSVGTRSQTRYFPALGRASRSRSA